MSQDLWRAYALLLERRHGPSGAACVLSQALRGEPLTVYGDGAQTRPHIERGIRREIARRQDSDQAAWRVLLEGDNQYREAEKLFAESRTLSGLFQIADARREHPTAP